MRFRYMYAAILWVCIVASRTSACSVIDIVNRQATGPLLKLRSTAAHSLNFTL
jgi:hypothetical protein